MVEDWLLQAGGTRMMVRAEVPSLAWQKFIEKRYGLKILEVKPFHSLYRSNSVRRIVTDKGLFSIKQYRGTEQSLSVLHRRIQWLVRKGYNEIPQWLKTLNNSVFVRWQGKILYLVEWVEGRPFEYSHTDFFHLGGKLRLLHHASVKTEALTGRSFLNQRRRRISRALFLMKRQTRISTDSQIESWYQSHRRECSQLLETADRELQYVENNCDSKSNLCTLVHGDVTAPNIIVVEDTIRLIDWERLSIGLAMEEFAKSVSNTALFRPTLIESALLGYQLSDSNLVEKALFRAFFRIPREVLQLVELAQRGGKQVNIQSTFGIITQTWTDRMNAVSWVDKHVQ